MVLPDISALNINGARIQPFSNDSVEMDADDRDLRKLKAYAKSLPYGIEPCSKMMDMLDFIILRIVQCVEAKDYEIGLMQWDSMLTYWSMLKYPIPKDKRIKLAKMYFHLSTVPGMSTQVVATCADALQRLTKSKKKLSIDDMRLPWKPLYDILHADLFLTRRQFEYTQLSWCMGYIADHARRFFHPAVIEEMLSTFVPQIDGTSLDSILAPQYYLLTFLPLTHPQSYLPMLFRMWESINSYQYDERMLHFLSKLAEMHVSPEVSNPRKVLEIPDDERLEGEGRPRWAPDEVKDDMKWPGLYKDVGIFSEHEWHLLMCKCLASMEIPLADAGSLTTGPSADSQAGFELERLPKPSWRITSLARIIVYSMAPDGIPVPPSNAPTPFFSPLPSGMNTPQIQTSTLGEFLAAPLGKKEHSQPRSYLAGSKALDSLARLIASTESFFHPSNSGAWTNDLSAFIKYIVYDFNKRWHEEHEPDCKTPSYRRLTKLMKRELVKSLRTVTLLAMFSQDSTTVSNIQSCLKSMSVMEPDLILHPILERAVPSLEALVETQRTIAVIKALGAIAPAIVSRDVYYSGAKHLVPILQLLIPGIDLNDPSKTLCTTAFLVEISQFIKIGDLTMNEELRPAFLDSEPTLPLNSNLPLPSFSLDELNGPYAEMEPRLTHEEEDALLKDSTGSFPDWIASFIRRVIQLLENLPDEGPAGSAGGTSEVQVVDAVTGACSQICVHLSEPLYDLVLNMIFDYASTNVRPNAVRAIHQLVECVANADPGKTLAKFFHFCYRNIRIELENGASSIRTTSASSPLPSDATLHWNLAILRGAIYNDGRAVLKYKDDLLALFRLLHDRTFSKRGFSWSGKLLCSTLLTLTHTYPLENKFVNPEEWNSNEFHTNHHRHWGKLYTPEEVTMSWHVPNNEEIEFALEIFRSLVEPTLSVLENLIAPGLMRDEVWRNEICRHLSFVRNAFSGIPTMFREVTTPEEYLAGTATSDILDEIPEMIASLENIKSGFCLDDVTDPRHRYMTAVKERYGTFLHNASVSLRQQGEENTVDAVDMLIRGVRTYMLEYGDSRDSYDINDEQYRSEKSVARQYAHQKVWPRAVYVRRARYYHAARLHWNCIERRRRPLEDALIDDVVEWSLWHYAGIRRSSQSLLDSIAGVYDGVRRRGLPVLLKALEPGTDDDRMKGALWTLNSSYFGKYAVSEPKLAPDTIKGLFGCQHNEKPSIQDCVSVVGDNCLSSFLEPCFLVYDVPTALLDEAVSQLKSIIHINNEAKESSVVVRCRNKRIERIQGMNEATQTNIDAILEIGDSPRTHWRYEIFAARCLRTLIRRDEPTSADHTKFFLDRIHDDHPTIRYYAQRGLMKISRNIKLRTFCPTPADLALMVIRNPLKTEVAVKPSHQLTTKVLADFKTPYDLSGGVRSPIFFDREPPGWAAWDNSITLYKPPSPTKSTFRPWEPASQDAIEAVRESVTDPEYWEKLAGHFSEENHETSVTQDNVSCVKSIFQLLEDEPFEALKPTMEKMIADKDQDTQRAAAELIAGVIGGSKHWPTSKQQKLWEWFTPMMGKILRQNIKTDTMMIWTSFLEYIFYHKDPRRVQPLVDFIVNEFNMIDFNAEMTFDAVKVLSLFRAFYEELGRKFVAWTGDVVARSWAEISSEHDEVRAYIGEILAFSQKIMWQPTPSTPTVDVFVKECRLLPADFDIMAMRGVYHKERVLELVDRFKVWREERLPGVRAFQSTYDRVGVTVCKWLFQSVHDVHAISTFDYILPLMPEIFRFTELHDNEELASRASTLMVRMCGVTPPLALVNPILDAIFDAIQNSPSWRVRLKALPLVQVFYFRNVPQISEIKIVEMLEVLCKCLDDEVVEVREMAATTLSGILRLSPRRSIITLKDRFVRLAKNSHIPPRQDAGYSKAVRQRHAAILGICALVDSYPYTVEKWMPELLTNVLAEHTYDPIPISTTVRKCASNFKRTHQDTWHEDSKRFDEDQLAALSTLLTGSSYYA
ncbi:Proteasome activator complex subunit 4 [Hypsizygus marmoreus]|uniref:Proteasome activator complex subunit 4 n=1 Tax=Hypsizygus marmoreus TaxID=39966 RepID=A0A369K4M5_HYPMA|nr:Proteasome activator complex subunit 4 [Hypsizygus marmoreus]